MNAKNTAVVAVLLIVCVPIGLGYALSVDTVTVDTWNVTDSVNVTDLMLNHSTDYFGDYAGITNNTDLGGVPPNWVKTSSVVSSYPVYDITDVPRTFVANRAQQVDYDNYRFTVSSGTITLIDSVGDTQYNTATLGALTFYVSGNTYTVNGYSFPFSGAHLSYEFSISQTIHFEIFNQTTTYADSSEGWRLNGSSGYWGNSRVNESVTMVMQFSEDCTATISGMDLSSHVYSGVTLIKAGDTLTVNGQNLGNYDTLRVIYSSGSVTISGLSGWPAMHSNAQSYNTITLENNLTDSFMVINLSDSGDVRYRVDNARVVAGSYPTTYDYSLNVGSMYPGKSNEVKLSSIGVYGDSLAINGVSYPIVDNSIIVDGHKIALRGAVISSKLNESGRYDIDINGYSVGDSATSALIYFGGEWSLTTNVQILEESQEDVMRWVPGGFGLSKDGFIVAGLLTGFIVFLVLGMSGKMSGSKIALLAFICGSAGICLLIMV